MLERFERLESQLMAQDLERLDAAILREFESMLTINVDWSEWDDTYRYMKDFNLAYEESNIDESTFENLKLAAILYFDPILTLQKQFGFDSETSQSKVFQRSFIDTIAELHLKQTRTDFSGLIELGEDLYLISSHPILTSEAEGPSRGQLVFLRLFDESFKQKIAAQTRLDTAFLKPSEMSDSSFITALSTKNKVDEHFNLTNNTHIFGFTQIKDIRGKGLLIAKVTQPRQIMAQGFLIVSRLTYLLTISGLLFSALVLWALRKSILSRLSRLSQSMVAISHSNSAKFRVKVEGSDEIGEVAVASNQMLDSLEKAFDQRQHDLKRQKLQNSLLINLAKEKSIVEGNIKELAQKITESILKGCQVDRASIWLFDDDMNHFICIDHLNKVTFEHGTDLTLPYNYLRQLISRLRHSGSVKLEDSLSAEEAKPVIESLGSSHKTEEQIVISIKYKEQLHGFIVAESFQPSYLSPLDEEVFLMSIADFVEQTIASKERIKLEKELWRLASYDNLTGIPNRSYFLQCLNASIDKAKLKDNMMALLFIDLDKFKPINDNYGHAAGDEMLKQVAQRMKLMIRDEDILARLGGDEFTILLTKIRHPKDALLVAEKIVKNIANPFTFEGNQLHPGCSIGIAVFPNDAEVGDDLLNLADSAMYQAKTSGRNKAKLYHQ